MSAEEIRSAIESAVAYLTENPDQARYTDTAATAVLTHDLRVRVHGPAGELLETDMPPAVGGTGAAPSPGWFLRAAMASCVASLVQMRAAMEGVALAGIEVTVDSESDDRGILGMNEEVPAGPLSSRVRVRLSATAPQADQLRAIAEWAVAHCPVADAVQRAVPVSTEVEIT